MARKPFTVSYPDGSKENIGATELAQMELRGEVQRIGVRSYVFTGIFVSKHFTCKDFGELSAILPDIEQRVAVKSKFLSGQFVVEYPQRLGGARERQAEEKPEALHSRLIAMGMPVTGFEAAA